jgi:hypothetical protein
MEQTTVIMQSEASVNFNQPVDIRQILPTFNLRPEEGDSTKQISIVDFTLCINKSKLQLKNVFEFEFKKHPKFLELVEKLYKNEIKHKFLG